MISKHNQLKTMVSSNFQLVELKISNKITGMTI